MNKEKNVTVLAILIFSMIIGGCAGTPKVLKQEDIRGIKKIAVVTSLSNNELIIMDHSQIMEQAPNPSGLIPALIASTIALAAAEANLRSVLDGNPDSLRQVLTDFPVKKVFDENFIKTFFVNREIISPAQVDSLGIDEYPTCKTVKGKTIKDYTPLCEKLNVDTVLQLNFAYGLAVCAKMKRPTAVVSTVMLVIDVENNKLLMRKEVSSDDYYEKGYTLDEFKANGGELYREEIVKAIQGLSYLVSSELGGGVPESLEEKSYWAPEK